MACSGLKWLDLCPYIITPGTLVPTDMEKLPFDRGVPTGTYGIRQGPGGSTFMNCYSIYLGRQPSFITVLLAAHERWGLFRHAISRMSEANGKFCS